MKNINNLLLPLKYAENKSEHNIINARPFMFVQFLNLLMVSVN